MIRRIFGMAMVMVILFSGICNAMNGKVVMDKEYNLFQTAMIVNPMTDKVIRVSGGTMDSEAKYFMRFEILCLINNREIAYIFSLDKNKGPVIDPAKPIMLRVDKGEVFKQKVSFDDSRVFFGVQGKLLQEMVFGKELTIQVETVSGTVWPVYSLKGFSKTINRLVEITPPEIYTQRGKSDAQ